MRLFGFVWLFVAWIACVAAVTMWRGEGWDFVTANLFAMEAAAAGAAAVLAVLFFAGKLP